MGSEIEKDDVAGPWPSEYKKRRGKLENQNCRRQTDGNQSERKRESTVSIRPFGFLFPPLHFSRMEIHGPSLVNPLLREYVNDFQLPRDLHVKISALGSCHWHFSTCGFSFGHSSFISTTIGKARSTVEIKIRVGQRPGPCQLWKNYSWGNRFAEEFDSLISPGVDFHWHAACPPIFFPTSKKSFPFGLPFNICIR